MNALWRLCTPGAPKPVSAREVLEETEPERGWAYSTVRTLLARLAEKGAVQVGQRGNTALYSPLVSREEARRGALRSLLDRAFDGAFGSLVQHMVSEERLSRRELRRLRRLLEEEEGR